MSLFSKFSAPKSNRKSRQRRRRQQALLRRSATLERLESRYVLNAAPVAEPDRAYFTDENTLLSAGGVGSSFPALLANDWDAEGSSLMMSVVDNPSNGSVTSFNPLTGEFSYLPNVGFTGMDSFTYKVNDGTTDSHAAAVEIAVGGVLGPQTKAVDTGSGLQLSGDIALAAAVTPGVGLVYNTTTLPEPIVAVDTFLRDSASTLDGLDAQLTFNGSAGSVYSYDVSSLTPGDAFRVAIQTDATSLATGRYDFTLELTTDTLSQLDAHDYSGSVNVVNHSSGSHAYGRGWQLAGLDSLAITASGALWVQSDGSSHWFEDNGSTYDEATGDLTFSTLVENQDGTYTLTDNWGNDTNFDSGGLLTSRVDTNGNTTSYTYTNGLLTTITDIVGRTTTLNYTNGQLSSVTDFAGRSGSLAYNGSGDLTSITQTDPDGAGPLTAPVTSFSYDTDGRLTTLTNALSDATSYLYGTHGRLTKVTHPDNSFQQWTATQTIGLPSGSSGNTVGDADPLGTFINERNFTSSFRTDSFGNTTHFSDHQSNVTTAEFDAYGQTVRLTLPDPDDAGALVAPVSVMGYDDVGNLVFAEHPGGASETWTYSSLSRMLSHTDVLGFTHSYDYDANGNRTSHTDPDQNQWTYTLDSSGRLTQETTPDPDGTGPLAAASTSYAYDSYGRLTTLTFADLTTNTFGYNTADQVTSITDELSYTSTSIYDQLGRLTSTTDRENATTSFTYDALGQVLDVTDALGGVTSKEYNNRGWVTKEIGVDPDGAGALERPEATYQYDATGNVTQIGYENIYGYSGNEPIANTFDYAGRKTKQTGPLAGMVTDYEYDKLGRVTKTEVATGTMGGDTIFEYDDAGNLIKQVELEPGSSTNGITQLFTHDDAGQVTAFTDPRGYTTDYEYNSRGQVLRTELPDPDGSGPVWRPQLVNSYDTLGRLTFSMEDWVTSKSYVYDSRNRLTEVILPNPDPLGSTPGPSLLYQYDDAGRLTTVTDTLSNDTTYEYDKEGRVTKVTLADPDGAGPLTAPETITTYNALGSVLTTTDALNNITSYEHDAAQRVTKITQADPDGAGPLTAPVTINTYGATGMLDSVLDPLGRQTSFQYDGMGRRTSVTDHQGNVTNYTYTLDSQIDTITEPDPDGTGPLAAPVTDYDYDDYQRLQTITDPASGMTSFTYDAMGNLLTLTDPVNNATSYAYDALGNVTMETNELGDAASYYYDTLGRLTKKQDRNERVIHVTSDDWNQVLSEQWFENASQSPELVVTTDTNGGGASEVQRVGFIDDMSSLYGDFTLTYDGQATGTISYDADAATVQSALVALSNLQAGDVTVVKVADSAGHQEWRLDFGGTLANTNLSQTTVDTSMLYYSGNLAEVEATDVDGSSTGGDEVQTVSLTNASGGTFRLAFEGHTTAPLTHAASAGQVETALEELSAIDDVTVVAGSSSWTITFVGSHSGLDQAALNGDASTITSGSSVHSIDYTYDLGGRLTAASDDFSDYAYTYDALGRVLTVDNLGTPNVPNVVLTSVFDAASNRTQLSATIDGLDDFVNDYAYDALHRLTQLTQQAQPGGNAVAEKRVDLAYNSGGQYTEIARYNDIAGGSANEIATSTYTYDTLARLTGLEYENGGVDLFTPYGWTFDDLGRITQFTSQDGNTLYSYDPTNQLTNADHDYQADESYSYDANGNRTMTGYQTGTNNQLLNDGTFSYTYDDEGNRSSKTNDTTNESVEYEWDFRNRLVRVTNKDTGATTTQVVEYTYDVFSRRIAQEVDTTSPFDMADATIERYLLDDVNGVTSIDGGNVVLDFVDADGTGSATMDHVHRYLYSNAVDQVLAQENIGASGTDDVYWLLVDNIGSVKDVVDNVATVETHFTYNSFGALVSGDTSKTRFRFTSRETDDSVDLQFNRARWFDTSVGAWLSQDPLGFNAGDTNLSRYVGNNVTNGTDPSGLIDPSNQKWPRTDYGYAAGPVQKVRSPALQGKIQLTPYVPPLPPMSPLERLDFAIEMGQLAAGAYIGSELSKEMADKWEVTVVRNNDAITGNGLRIVKYVSVSDPSMVVVALAGTDPPNGSAKQWDRFLVDVATDVLNGLGIMTSQYMEATIATAMVNHNHGGNVHLVGHSLGGGLASFVGTMLGLNVSAFNPAGLHDGIRVRSDADERAHVTVHRSSGDFLTNSQNSLGQMPEHIGSTFTVEGEGDPFSQHGMVNLIDFLRNDRQHRAEEVERRDLEQQGQFGEQFIP